MKYKSFFLACSIMLMFAINNCMFLKNTEDDVGIISCPGINTVSLAGDASTDCGKENTNEFTNDIQGKLDAEVMKLSKRQALEQDSINHLQARETANILKSIHNQKSEPGSLVKGQNLIQFDAGNAINDFGKFLNLKVGPPTIANSISNTKSVAKGVADDSSVINTVQNVKSTTNADAEGEKNSIAVSNVIGNTEANSNNLAVDNSKAVNVIDNVNTGNSTANASENSLSVSSVKTNQVSDTNTAAADNSTAVGGTQMTTNTESITNADQGSIADSKATSEEKSNTNTAAVNNSTSIGVSAVNTDTNSNADASNQSLAQSLSESQNTANTNTLAVDNSAAVGASVLNSTANSTALATDGGNALSVAESKSTLGTDSVANNSSSSVVTNTGGSESNATSVSNGTAAPYQNPLETQAPSTPSNQTEEAPTSLVPSSRPLQATVPLQDEVPSKMPLIGDDILKTTFSDTVLSRGTEDFMDKVKNQVEKVAPSEVAKETILRAPIKAEKQTEEKTTDCKIDRDLKTATEKRTIDLKSDKDICQMGSVTKPERDIPLTSGKLTIPKTTTLRTEEGEMEGKKMTQEQEENRRREDERNRYQEEKDRLRAEEKKLIEENRRLKKEKQQAEDKARALKKAEERRKRKERKLRERRRRKALKRKEREMEKAEEAKIASQLQKVPEVIVDVTESPKLKYDSDCEMNQQVARDFEQGIKEANVANDPRFCDEVMFEDKIKEYDMRCNDAKVTDDCEKICKDEKLGKFVESEIQDILPGKFLFKCKCTKGITDWYIYDNRTDKSKAFGSSTRNLLDEERDQEICGEQATALQAGPADQTTATEAQAQTTITEDLEDDDDEACDVGGKTQLGDCFNFFIENKFKNIQNRMNKMKARNCSYINDIRKRQANRQPGKAQETVDNTADRIGGTATGAGNTANSGAGVDNLKKIQSNLSGMKQQLNAKKSSVESPEDCYFKNRNAKDEDKFNQKLQSRFEENKISENKRFQNRFENSKRYAARDKEETTPKKPAVKAADSKKYFCDALGKIKTQNKNYLDRITSMFGGNVIDIESE